MRAPVGATLRRTTAGVLALSLLCLFSALPLFAVICRVDIVLYACVIGVYALLTMSSSTTNVPLLEELLEKSKSINHLRIAPTIVFSRCLPLFCPYGVFFCRAHPCYIYMAELQFVSVFLY